MCLWVVRLCEYNGGVWYLCISSLHRVWFHNNASHYLKLVTCIIATTIQLSTLSFVFRIKFLFLEISNAGLCYIFSHLLLLLLLSSSWICERVEPFFDFMVVLGYATTINNGTVSKLFGMWLLFTAVKSGFPYNRTEERRQREGRGEHLENGLIRIAATQPKANQNTLILFSLLCPVFCRFFSMSTWQYIHTYLYGCLYVYESEYVCMTARATQH